MIDVAGPAPNDDQRDDKTLATCRHLLAVHRIKTMIDDASGSAPNNIILGASSLVLP